MEKENNFLVEEQKNGEGRGGIYLENEVYSCRGEEGKFSRTDGTERCTGIEGSIRGSRGPKNIR